MKFFFNLRLTSFVYNLYIKKTFFKVSGIVACVPKKYSTTKRYRSNLSRHSNKHCINETECFKL